MTKNKVSLSGLSRCVLAFAFVSIGALHFINPQVFCKIVPSFIPWVKEVVYISGLAEIAGGIGLLISALRNAAVWGLILLLLAVFPANINMALHPEIFPAIPIWILYLRLPLQALIIFWVWSCRIKSPEKLDS
ncbi:MAG: hypothetical protein K2X27_17435 [Candidatus Obscuribacterales bacterium]|nr:hypothetical protein [Candidatus Obscuribacterales bacterium]